MSVDFKRIKKYSKASKEIDEKLEFLNKELKKTGMCESIANTTAGVYVGSKEEENKNFSDFESLSHNGQGLGFSGADGNHIGGAIVDSNGVALSPPHPVTGARTTALHVQNGTGNTIPLRPGKTTTRGDGNNPPIITMGSAVWFFDPTFDSGQGKWCNLEYFTAPNQSVGAMGFWDTNNAGFFFHNTDVSQHPCGDISSKIAGINFGANGVIGAEKTTVLTQTKLGDSGFLPINIPISIQAFFSLLGKAKDKSVDAIKSLGGFLSDLTNKLAEMDKQFGFRGMVEANNLAQGINDGVNLLNNAKDVIKTSPVDENGQIRAGAKGSIENPLKNSVSDATARTILQDIDLTAKPEILSDVIGVYIQNNVYAAPGAIGGRGSIGAKGTHNNLPGKGKQDGGYPPPFINENGDLIIPDTYHYGPGGHEESWLVKTTEALINSAEKVGIDISDETEADLLADAGTIVDQSIGALMPGMPGRKDPIVHFTTIITKEQFDRIKNENKGVSESLNESVGLGHFEPTVLNVDINDIRKGVMPEFPKDPPPEMINGYSVKSRLAPKIIEGEPFIKITKKDLAKNHKLTDKEISEFMSDIKMINDYIKKNPAELKYAMIRYPKDDPRLAQLNWQMDQMLDASKEYTDKQFPENQKLFDKIKKKIKNTIDQTDPKNFKGTKLPKFDKTHLEDFKRKKEVYSRFMKKPVKTKKLFQKTKK